jgi:hypothetical protein
MKMCMAVILQGVSHMHRCQTYDDCITSGPCYFDSAVLDTSSLRDPSDGSSCQSFCNGPSHNKVWAGSRAKHVCGND